MATMEKLLRSSGKLSEMSRNELTRASIESTRALVQGTAKVNRLDDALLGLCTLTFDYIEENLGTEPIKGRYFEWYFQGIDYLNKSDLSALGRHIYSLPSVISDWILRAQNGREKILFADKNGQVFLNDYYFLGEFESFEKIRVKFEDDDKFRINTLPFLHSLDAIAKFGEYPIHNTSMSLSQVGRGKERIIQKYQQNLKGVAIDSEPFRMITPSKLEGNNLKDKYVEKLSEALLYIRIIDNSLFSEINVLTNEVCLLRGYPFIGGSSINHFGTSFFNLLPEWSKYCYADHIIHEAAHQKIHVTFELNPILSNPNDLMAKSPIRTDSRPLEGVLHATFVFYRLSEFFFKAVAKDYSEEAEIRLHRHLLGFYDGMDQLEEYAIFTRTGLDYFEYLKKAKAEFQEMVPFPDPCLYNRIPIDYEKPKNLASSTMD